MTGNSLGVRFVLLRHGQSTWNVEGRLQGQTMAVPLTELGRAQALRAAAEVAVLVAPGTPVYSSDQLRAVQTATVVAATLGTTALLTPLLREQALGDMEGRLAAECVAEPVPDGAHISEIQWGGGESVADVYARSVEFLHCLPPGLAEVVVVGHGDSLRILRTALEGRGHREVDYEQVLANCTPVVIRAVPPRL